MTFTLFAYSPHYFSRFLSRCSSHRSSALQTAAHVLLFAVGLLLGAPHSAAAENLTALKHAGLQIRLMSRPEQPAGEFVLSLERAEGDGPLTADVFSLENPVRLVVDVPNVAVQSAKQVELRNDKVSALRIGIHPNKMRIVIDSRLRQAPVYSVAADDSGTGLRIVFSFAAVSQPRVGEEFDVMPEPSGQSATSAPAVAPSPPAAPVPTAGILVVPPPKESPEAPPAATSASTEQPPAAEGPPAAPEQPVLGEAVEIFPQENLDATEDLEIVAPDAAPAELEAPKPERVERAVKLPPSDATGAPSGTDEPPSGAETSPAASVAEVAPVREVPAPAAATTKPSAPAADGRATVKGIFFKSTPEHGPSLVVHVDGLGRYSLSKKQENLFELVLEDATFAGQHLELPQFSPDTFDGLDVLIAERRGNDVALKIYVGDNVRLAPFRIQGELWIKMVR